ncbi:TIGR03557 family F420-dependent LLM class oxidoreductase [Isoptericola sediminis]|uniref:TIGR03557 family F420-dependent LLM class oxidoreductase n=1 Tax=Isoptericola sediminis TaxID=2733572 RepID=A0A849K560_9MICO|nr:TIGR03557 family F420-dependent LLM class oxidoreductase [Isoptericola sediminis]NNU27540.1 TIGR03557 family F420-dependent LLM class oxidoreductase [Isoptericola sediminis]
MTRFGYTLMTEQSGPRDLVDYAVRAEEVGFDFEVMSDHYFPWLDSQGHSPYAWSVLGAVAHATRRTGLMSFVTCPTLRYHPAVVAQKAATTGLLSEGRFTLGLGAGENLNEHVVGAGWPAVDERHEMLTEAVQIIGALFQGDLMSFRGDHFQVDSARLWDLPDDPVGIGVAVSGGQSVGQFATLADHVIATESQSALLEQWDAERDAADLPASRKFAQVPISWDPDRDAAVERAHDQFRWFGLGWPVNANLPTTEAFGLASSFVRPDDVASSITCGPDLDAVVDAVSAYWEAGFTDIALHQIGDEKQEQFLAQAAGPLLEKLRAAAPQ